MAELVRFLRDVFRSRALIVELTKNDFASRYLGSSLGFAWAFLQPALTVLTLWFVFEIGFKVQPVGNVSFFLWLAAGMLPWFFIAESIPGATNAIIEKSFLVQKVVFRVSTLPIIKILSALIIHLFLLAILLAIFLLDGRGLPLTAIQIPYYLFAACTLVLGLTWMTSALTVFLRDVGQVVGILLQFGFWMTPIFWSLDVVPEGYRRLIRLNPLYYIIEGYRESLVGQGWFWEHPSLSLYFWAVTGLLLVSGALVFHRLRPHFADVL